MSVELPRRVILSRRHSFPEIRQLCERLGIPWQWDAEHGEESGFPQMEPLPGDVYVGCMPIDAERRPQPLPADVRIHAVDSSHLFAKQLERAYHAGTRAAPAACLHPLFSISAEVLRYGDPDATADGYALVLWVACQRCGQRFRFKGVPVGASMQSLTTSGTGSQLRAPLEAPGPGEEGTELKLSLEPLPAMPVGVEVDGHNRRAAEAQVALATHDFEDGATLCRKCQLPRTDIRIRRTCAGAPQSIVPTEEDRAAARSSTAHVFHTVNPDPTRFPPEQGMPCIKCEVQQEDPRAAGPCAGGPLKAMVEQFLDVWRQPHVGAPLAAHSAKDSGGDK